jgi:hypothetical protein
MAESQVSQRISQQGTAGALDRSTPGLIGYVIKYYPNSHKIEPQYRHSVDVEVRQGTQTTKYYRVPCFVYAQGLIDHGLVPNDRVWVQFINGDKGRPIVTAYYREPSQLDMFWEDLKYDIGDFFGRLTGWVGDEGDE